MIDTLRLVQSFRGWESFRSVVADVYGRHFLAARLAGAQLYAMTMSR